MPFDGKYLTESQLFLMDALDYIKKHGWCQDDLLREDGRACMIGALQAVTIHRKEGRVNYPLECVYRLGKAIGLSDVFANNGSLIGRWNDNKNTTYADVIGAFENAISMNLVKID